eukprot:13249904-Alexandrium_andersonii.AAC.1
MRDAESGYTVCALMKYTTAKCCARGNVAWTYCLTTVPSLLGPPKCNEFKAKANAHARSLTDRR